MPVEQDSFTELMRSVCAGDRAAAERFCTTYQGNILRVVRRRLLKQLRSKFDSLDLVHDVWASFFAQPPLVDFASPAALVRYLEAMARNKVREAVQQRMKLQKFNVGRERPLPSPDVDPAVEKALGAGPTPSQVVIAEEEWERLNEGNTPQHRCILQMLRQGCTRLEIAERLHTNEKTVRRLLRRLARRSEE